MKNYNLNIDNSKKIADFNFNYDEEAEKLFTEITYVSKGKEERVPLYLVASHYNINPYRLYDRYIEFCGDLQLAISVVMNEKRFDISFEMLKHLIRTDYLAQQSPAQVIEQYDTLICMKKNNKKQMNSFLAHGKSSDSIRLEAYDINLLLLQDYPIIETIQRRCSIVDTLKVSTYAKIREQLESETIKDLITRKSLSFETGYLSEDELTAVEALKKVATKGYMTITPRDIECLSELFGSVQKVKNILQNMSEGLFLGQEELSSLLNVFVKKRITIEKNTAVFERLVETFDLSNEHIQSRSINKDDNEGAKTLKRNVPIMKK